MKAIRSDAGKRRYDTEEKKAEYLVKQDKLPRKCPKCKKTLAHKYALARHLMLHANHRPHKCSHPGCDKAFVGEHDLKL